MFSSFGGDRCEKFHEKHYESGIEGYDSLRLIITNSVENMCKRTESTFATYETNDTFVGVSTDSNTIGVCYTTSSYGVMCTQHNFTGKLKLKTTIYGFNQIRQIEAVYNVASGGLLFFARTCEGPGCVNIVVKFDVNGKSVGNLEIGKYGCGLSWGYNQKGILYGNNNNEYCASLACYGTVGRNGIRHEGQLELLGKCFVNSDF